MREIRFGVFRRGIGRGSESDVAEVFDQCRCRVFLRLVRVEEERDVV